MLLTTNFIAPTTNFIVLALLIISINLKLLALLFSIRDTNKYSLSNINLNIPLIKYYLLGLFA